MKKSQTKYYIFLGITFLMLIGWEVLKPKPTDWTMTLSRKDKIPYGTYVLYNCLPDLFPGKKIEINDHSFYQYNDNKNKTAKNFIIINQDFSPDSIDNNRILDLADAGNNFFISAFRFSQKFADTLGFSVTPKYYFDNDSVYFRMVNKSLEIPEKFLITKANSDYFFTKFDTAKSVVLSVFNDSLVNLIRIPFGKGSFIVSSEPAAFTNYVMLKNNNSKYVFAALSYLPKNDVVWDQYYKAERELNKSTLDYIFSNPSLKAAYYLLLAVLTAYMLFSAKRRQRIIPVYASLKNSSLEFIKTLGHLYLHTQNHKDIALKKFNYFTDFLRTKYFISQQSIAANDAETIASKTDYEIEKVKNILNEYDRIQKSHTLSQTELLAFNKMIEDFYEKLRF